MFAMFLRYGSTGLIFLCTVSGCKQQEVKPEQMDSGEWSVQQFYAVPEGTVYGSLSCINKGTDSAKCRALGNSRAWTKTNYDSLYGYYLVNPEDGSSIQASIHGSSTMKDNNPVTDLKWLDATTGWLIRSGQVFKTTDGGHEWNWMTNPCPLSASAFSFLHDGRLGWAVGRVGLLSRMIDGASWNCQDISNLSEHAMNAVYFSDTLFGWAAGELGTILHTETGGISWFPQYSSTADALRAVHFSDRRNGWAVGAHGTILHTVDGGENWKSQESHTLQPLFAVSFLDSAEGWAVGAYGAIVHTTDGGSHWIRQITVTRRNLFAVDFVSRNLGYAVGDGSTLLRFSR